MPRVAEHYSVPVGTDGVTDQTVESGRYNAFIHDVELDLNTPRPISAGGTGATNGPDAMVALGGEITRQIVTNYDSFPFKSGSFSSSAGATGEPVAGHGFTGICYVDDIDLLYMTLEARDMQDTTVPGRLYIRQKLAGVWGPWTLDSKAGTDFANTKVAKAGDTMTGNLQINATNPVLFLNSAVGANAAAIYGMKGGTSRWIVSVGNAVADTGSGNTGSDFAIYRCADGGSPIDIAFAINRSTGQVYGNGIVPTIGPEFTNKTYVDAKFAAVDLSGKVSKAGDTMTGDLAVAKALPIISLHKTASGQANAIYGTNNGSSRWAMQIGDGTAEAASNVGSDFALHAFDNTGTYLGARLTMLRASGNVGLGTATPSVKLEVAGDIKAASIAATGIVTVSNSLAATGIQATQGNFYADAVAGNNSALWLRNDAAAMKGILYWDRAADTVKLLNASFAGVSIDSIGIVRTGNGMQGRAGTVGAYDINAHNFYWLSPPGNAQAWIDVTNIGNISITCDYRTKKDVLPLPSTWDAVKALKPVSYTGAEFTPPVEKVEYLKRHEKAAKENLPPLDPLAPMFSDDDEPQWGFLAHELQETLLTSAATATKDAYDAVQSPNLMAVVAALTRALQEAMARIEALEARP